ncbi:MAG: hypothetical protein M0Z78_06090 [Betaproteobacteria bacterium]|nr:hypothetical protein [Betaproteobacteria bacterium]
MPRNLSLRTQAINAAKARIGDLLNGYVRAKDTTQAGTVRAQTLETMQEVLVTPDEAAANYRQRCENFLDNVIAVRGIPFKEIGVEEDAPLQSCSGEWVTEHFDELLPKIRRQLDSCVDRFLSHAQSIFPQYQSGFLSLLDDFLSAPPKLVKEIGPQITPIKREAGYYARWDKQVGIYTNVSFLNEVNFIFNYRSGQFIAAEWDYSNLDEQMDFAPSSDHQKRDGAIYTVKDNWALQKGMMIPGSAGYVEDVDIPGRQLGCMCHLTWLSSLTDLPEDMLTDIGKEAVRVSRERTRQIMSEWEKEQEISWGSRALRKMFGRKP